MPLYACNPPTGYSNRGADWLNPSAQLYRMNFALDLAAGAVAGVSADIRGLIRGGGGDPESPPRRPRRSTAWCSAGTLTAALARRGRAGHDLERRAGLGASGRAALRRPRDAGEVTR